MKSSSKKTNSTPHGLKRSLALPQNRTHVQPKVSRTNPAISELIKGQPKRPALAPKIQARQQAKVTNVRTLSIQPKRVSVMQPKPFKSTVVQAVKIYPNLHPGAVEPVNPASIFHLKNFAGQYRLHRHRSHNVNVPNQQYNFVRTREGDILLHSRYRHPSIAEGKQVLYAGEIFFNNGQLEWWSNGSGHYQPNADDAEQANLPMDQFFSYQQIIKGEHKRKR